MIYANDLRTEKKQLLEEGKDISSVEKELDRLTGREKELENNPAVQLQAMKLLDRTIKLKDRKGYEYVEPSGLEGIKKTRPSKRTVIKKSRVDDKFLYDRFLGAWLGRCAGCLLGKPVEGWKKPRMWGYLKETGRFPLDNYFSRKAADKILKEYKIPAGGKIFREDIKYMVEDDDTNYTVTGFLVVRNHGKGFTPKNVADFWLNNMPILHAYTAERAAYRNFVNDIFPPESALFRNPSREWIGAQIRADAFGYLACGNPEMAAEFAWRDASISHVKNGIYGEMWVAAMLAAAPYVSGVKEVILSGLSQIPEKSRLTGSINKVLKWKEDGMDYYSAVEKLHKEWDENIMHGWCHTISNAMVVAIGLLWGEDDFENSICKAVQACFDTDCNGATVGSIIGMMHGAKKLPGKWIKPLNDTLLTGISGYNRVKISDMAKETLEVHKKIRLQKCFCI